MITGLQGTTIWSEDVNNLLPFYRDTVGLKVGMESDGFIVMGDPQQPALCLGTHSEVHGKNADPARHIVTLGSDDVDGDFQRLKGAGVEFIAEPVDFDNVRIATFKDPEDNLVQLLKFNG